MKPVEHPVIEFEKSLVGKKIVQKHSKPALIESSLQKGPDLMSANLAMKSSEMADKQSIHGSILRKTYWPLTLGILSSVTLLL